MIYGTGPVKRSRGAAAKPVSSATKAKAAGVRGERTAGGLLFGDRKGGRSADFEGGIGCRDDGALCLARVRGALRRAAEAAEGEEAVEHAQTEEHR